MEDTQRNNDSSTMSQCSACGKEVSKRATACPHCGKALDHVETAVAPEKKISTGRKNSIIMAIAFVLAGVFLLTTIGATVLFFQEHNNRFKLSGCTSTLRQIVLELKMEETNERSDIEFRKNPIGVIVKEKGLTCHGNHEKNSSSYIIFPHMKLAPDNVLAMDKPGNHKGFYCMLLASGKVIIFPSYDNNVESVLRSYYILGFGSPSAQDNAQLNFAAAWDKNNK